MHADAVGRAVVLARADRAVLALIARRAEALTLLAHAHIRAIVWTNVREEAHVARLALVARLAFAPAVDAGAAARAVAQALAGSGRAIDAPVREEVEGWERVRGK